jgi:hypothetical protein
MLKNWNAAGKFDRLAEMNQLEIDRGLRLGRRGTIEFDGKRPLGGEALDLSDVLDSGLGRESVVIAERKSCAVSIEEIN